MVANEPTWDEANRSRSVATWKSCRKTISLSTDEGVYACDAIAPTKAILMLLRSHFGSKRFGRLHAHIHDQIFRHCEHHWIHRISRHTVFSQLSNGNVYSLPEDFCELRCRSDGASVCNSGDGGPAIAFEIVNGVETCHVATERFLLGKEVSFILLATFMLFSCVKNATCALSR